MEIENARYNFFTFLLVCGLLNELHLKCKSELYVWKKRSLFPLRIHIFFSPSPQLVSLKARNGLDCFLQGVWRSEGDEEKWRKKTKDMQREVPGKGRH